MPSPGEKRQTYRKLHESGCFVIPNPWDIGSARYLQHLGFKALASTSAGYAFAQGLPDNAVSRDMMLEHLRARMRLLRRPDATRRIVEAVLEGGVPAR